MNTLDRSDLRILDELQRDGSLTNAELARRIGLSPSPCLARVKALEAGEWPEVPHYYQPAIGDVQAPGETRPWTRVRRGA